MKILLTGGSGMVGRNLQEQLRGGHHNLIAPSSNELDLTSLSTTLDYLRTHKPDLVVHAAGRVGGIQANMQEPFRYFVENLDMGRNIICAALDAGVTKLINLGSSCMYPRDHNEALREEQILTGELEPTNEGYALAKIATAKLCEYAKCVMQSAQYKTIIPCNLYGRFDKFDPKHSHLLPAIIEKIHRAKSEGIEKVEIWGDGSARREFMYAGDFAHALISAIDDFDSIPSLMNVGLGQDFSIKEYYEAVAEVLGYKGGFIFDTTKPVGMARKLVNIERQTAWGWAPKHSLQDGIAATYQYYLQEYNV
ncbi:GDP-L-fucose synthase family protein [Sphingorhabdus buctiana]|uniref:GDP-L-fucose synthase n=1 Tax=Sphingorhabdus buctiana TaxID=1508805 RepID=A0ABW4MCN2_9SPHN